MFGTFKKTEPGGPAPSWLAEAGEVQQRWVAFLQKLETRANELCEASIPELKAIFGNGRDYNEISYGQVKAGILGQLENIRKKAYDTNEEKINGFYEKINDSIDFHSPDKDRLYKFRDECRQHHNALENRLSHWRAEIDSIEAAKDPEAEYREILQEYENIKNKFTCTQCGGHLQVEKIFFITTHVTCPYCKTQNTFEPGTQARNLEFLARQLAEQRTQYLLNDYLIHNRQVDMLFHELRNLKSDAHFAPNQSEKNKLLQKITGLENELTERNKKSAQLYEHYLRTMFDEWNSIVPDLAKQNEGFYRRLLEDFRKTIKS